MALSPQWLDELRSRITLSSVISRTTKLQRAGREFKACCPFHNEKTPSFTVNDEKGFYHCFGCGAHGDVIRWMTDQRGLSFMDAVKELAAEAGMEVPAPDPRAAQQQEQRAGLHDVMAAAQDWFKNNLFGPDGAEARNYLKLRGFDDYTINRFGFGYAPNDRQAIKQALGQFEVKELIEAGLLIDVEGRDPYARFRDRLMLPIQDARQRVIAFGGRILDAQKTDAPKYLNSPDTPLFDKGRTLYNIHRASAASRKSNRLIVVEGYMDVIALADAGFEDAVAPLGTALTEFQIEHLWRMAEVPILCFDGDAAGQRAAMRAATKALPMLKPGHSLRFVTLPHSMDPDDIIKRSGTAGMELQLEESFSLLDFLWLQEKIAAPIGTPEEKAGLKARLEAHVDRIQHIDIKRLYRQELFDEFYKFAYRKTDRLEAEKQANADADPGARRWRRIAASEAESFNKYMRKRLGAAIVRGLMHWPDQIEIYAEDLARTRELDPRIDAILDVLEETDEYNSSNFLVEFSKRKILPPDPEEFGYLRFPFAIRRFEREIAIPALEKALHLYMSIPAVRSAYESAQAQYESNFASGDQEQVEAFEREVHRLREKLEKSWRDLRTFEKAYEPVG